MAGLSTEEIIGIAGLAVALVALVLACALAIRLRRLRGDQRAVLGATGNSDLVEHAARLERGFVELRDWVEEISARTQTRMDTVEQRIDDCVAHRALVRYDAYGEMSGQQSSSLALLDAYRSGIVVSSIHHRDSARVYFKQIVAGESEVELSPEEREAVEQALGEGRPVQP